LGRPVGELKLDDAEVQITLGTKREEGMVEGSQSGSAQKFRREQLVRELGKRRNGWLRGASGPAQKIGRFLLKSFWLRRRVALLKSFWLRGARVALLKSFWLRRRVALCAQKIWWFLG
jgi:hypothetical protein